LKGTQHSIVKSKIYSISIRDLPQITVAPASYFRNMCMFMSNLTKVDIKLPSTIDTIDGDYVFANMFSCTGVSSGSFNADFSIDQTESRTKVLMLTSNASFFCKEMFT
jgi:hypothetical protein